MLFHDAKDIISGSYYHTGDLAVKITDWFNRGYGKSDKYKQTVKKAILIDSELEFLFEHVVYNTDGTIKKIVRCTDVQINKSLRYLTDIAGVKNTAAVPVFRKIYVTKEIVVNTGSGGGGAVVGGVQYRGLWDGSSNVVPSGTILAGYMWKTNTPTTTLLGPDGGIVPAGHFILALVDSPGALLSNESKWAIIPGVGS